MPAPQAKPVTLAEAKALFAGLGALPALALAISGGPDSTALMLLAARWRTQRKRGPKLIAVTVDHGLRKEAKAEAAAVARLARKLKVAHRILRWRGPKPKTGLQQAARLARYRLLAQAAREAGAPAVLTAHTLDDQAETVLIRMMRGSGVSGLAAMSRLSPLLGAPDLELVRPLLDIPKSRLLATLKAQKIPYAEDASNRDPRFARARLRELMPALVREGLDARRLALLARRLRRADAAIEAAVERAQADLALPCRPGVRGFDAPGYAELPAEVGLRLLGRALARAGDEGPVELAKLETLKTALDAAQTGKNPHFRRTLAGAIVTVAGKAIMIERAPRRQGKGLTTQSKR